MTILIQRYPGRLARIVIILHTVYTLL